jgi:hypothetical protein
MVTVIRWLMLKSTQTKCRLAFWRLMEQLITEAVKKAGNATQESERGK